MVRSRRAARSSATFRQICASIAILWVPTVLAFAKPPGISAVKISPTSFNPSTGQKATIGFDVDQSGVLDLIVLDRDGFAIRSLATARPVERGHVTLGWDGKDESGKVVADEAYSLKIDLKTPTGVASYFPSNDPEAAVEARVTFYDRMNGTLGYYLSKPARVHFQAGSGKTDLKTQEFRGACLKTVINREPRAAGNDIEVWNGFDEGGTIYVPDLPDFRLSLYATALPENSLITTGNRRETFLEQAMGRPGKSLITRTTTNHGMHQGLTVFEDVSPRLTFRVTNATWLPADKAWQLPPRELTLEIALDGPSAAAFAKEPGGVMVLLDDEPVVTTESTSNPMKLSVRLPNRKAEIHRVVVNWVSDYGPVAANAIVVKGSYRILAEAASKKPDRTGVDAKPAGEVSGGSRP
jgi:hypothetical protein